MHLSDAPSLNILGLESLWIVFEYISDNILPLVLSTNLCGLNLGLKYCPGSKWQTELSLNECHPHFPELFLQSVTFGRSFEVSVSPTIFKLKYFAKCAGEM